jgi:hypothetical protein
MTVSDLCFSASGLVINLPRSKADQEQAGDKVAIPFGEQDDTCPIKALREWLTETKNGTARTIHLNADAVAAIESARLPV